MQTAILSLILLLGSAVHAQEVVDSSVAYDPIDLNRYIMAGSNFNSPAYKVWTNIPGLDTIYKVSVSYGKRSYIVESYLYYFPNGDAEKFVNHMVKYHVVRWSGPDDPQTYWFKDGNRWYTLDEESNGYAVRFLRAEL